MHGRLRRDGAVDPCEMAEGWETKAVEGIAMLKPGASWYEDVRFESVRV